MPEFYRNTQRGKPITYEVSADGCFVCTSHAPSKTTGYPITVKNGKKTTVARFVYESIHGDLPIGQVTRHTCDNRLCINEQHLIPGTQADNVHDTDSRGRRVTTAALSDDQVRSILSSRLPYSILARHFGVSKSAIGLIKVRKTYVHIE